MHLSSRIQLADSFAPAFGLPAPQPPTSCHQPDRRQANAIYLELERMGFKVDPRPPEDSCARPLTLSFTRTQLVLLPSLLLPLASKAWYDNRADDLTKEGMLKGIEQAAAFVLFLSTDVLQRPYCQMEIRHALALKKPIVFVHGERDHNRCLLARIV